MKALEYLSGIGIATAVYPDGGAATKAITGGFYQPDGATISTAKQ